MHARAVSIQRRNRQTIQKGYVGTADGFDFLTSNLLPVITNGNDVTGVAVESSVLAPATGATQLGVDGLTTTTGTVAKGSVFTIAGVYAVHRSPRWLYPYLQQFVVTADATADGSGKLRCPLARRSIARLLARCKTCRRAC